LAFNGAVTVSGCCPGSQSPSIAASLLFGFESQAGGADALPDGTGPASDPQGRLNQHDEVRQIAADELLDARSTFAQVLDGDGEPLALGKVKRALPVNCLTRGPLGARVLREGTIRRGRAFDGFAHPVGELARRRGLTFAKHAPVYS
jgi:hypothetical protein